MIETIKGLHRRFPGLGVCHLDKPKASGTTSVTVLHNARMNDLAMGRKELLKLVGISGKGKIPYV